MNKFLVAVGLLTLERVSRARVNALEVEVLDDLSHKLRLHGPGAPIGVLEQYDKGAFSLAYTSDAYPRTMWLLSGDPTKAAIAGMKDRGAHLPALAAVEEVELPKGQRVVLYRVPMCEGLGWRPREEWTLAVGGARQAQRGLVADPDPPWERGHYMKPWILEVLEDIRPRLQRVMPPEVGWDLGVRNIGRLGSDVVAFDPVYTYNSVDATEIGVALDRIRLGIP